MSRRNRSNRRRIYGQRQHEVRERRPTDSSKGEWQRDEGWNPELIDDARRDAYDAEGWAR